MQIGKSLCSIYFHGMCSWEYESTTQTFIFNSQIVDQNCENHFMSQTFVDICKSWKTNVRDINTKPQSAWVK